MKTARNNSTRLRRVGIAKEMNVFFTGTQGALSKNGI